MATTVKYPTKPAKIKPTLLSPELEAPSPPEMPSTPPPNASTDATAPRSPISSPLQSSKPEKPSLDSSRGSSPIALVPSHPLPSPPIVLTPSPTAFDSPSMIRSRSSAFPLPLHQISQLTPLSLVGRNVIISGIEFEPTDSAPATPGAHFPQLPVWLAEEPLVLPPAEALEFFAALRSPVQEVFALPPFDADVDASLLDSARSTVFFAPAPAARPTLFVVHESEEAAPESDSQVAREARWSALVAEADRGPPEPPSPEADDEETAPLALFPLAMPFVEPVASLHARPSTFFDRVGLGTIGRAGPVGTLSRSQSFSAAARSKGRSAVESWIFQGDPDAHRASDDKPTFSIEVGSHLTLECVPARQS